MFPGFPGVFEWLAGLGAFSQGQGQKNEAKRFTPGKAGNFVTLLGVACSIVYFDAWLAVAGEFCLYAADVCMLSFQKTRDLGTSSGNYDYSRNLDSINTMSSSFISEDSLPDAASEKELVGVDCVRL